MSAVITISLSLTAAQARLVAADAVLSKGLAPGLAMAAKAAVQEHLLSHYTQKPNKLGGQTTGYWQGVYNSAVAATSGGDGKYDTTVTLSGVGLRMKLEGGVIKPSGRISVVTGRPIKFLTIPVIAEAHGKRASEFPFLKARGKFADGGGGVLYAPRAGSDFGTVYFVLARSATIKPDPNIFPPAAVVLEEMRAAVAAAMLSTGGAGGAAVT